MMDQNAYVAWLLDFYGALLTRDSVFCFHSMWTRIFR
jgi:predicted DNA-binding protein YlxM (UPF0122 family)